MESKKSAQEVKMKGKNSKHSQTEAISRELAALKSVLKAVEVYKLEAEYPRENLVKQIAKLGQLRADRKRKAEAVAALSNSKTMQQQKPNKRPWPLASTSKPAVTMQTPPAVAQSQPQLGLADQTPYMGLAGSYSLAATGSLYNYAGPRLFGTPMDLGGLQSPPRSYLYPSQSLVGIGGLYDRPEHYGDYPSWGVPPYYGSSLYPWWVPISLKYARDCCCHILVSLGL